MNMTPSPDRIDTSPPLRHVSLTSCYALDCEGIAELGEAYCWEHVGVDDWVERLRRGLR